MYFRILHFLALRALRLASLLSDLAVCASVARSVYWHESDIEKERARILSKIMPGNRFCDSSGVRKS